MNPNTVRISYLETVPMDLVSLSFWFSKNAILSRERRRKLFLTNNVFERIILICQSLKVNECVLITSLRYSTLFKFHIVIHFHRKKR